MELINLTPHSVTVILPCGRVHDIPTSGTVARCKVDRKVVGEVKGIPITRATFGEVEGLPEPKEGVAYIVSSIVATALPDRDDLLIPDGIIRDENGVVIGCHALATV